MTHIVVLKIICVKITFKVKFADYCLRICLQTEYLKLEIREYVNYIHLFVWPFFQLLLATC